MTVGAAKDCLSPAAREAGGAPAGTGTLLGPASAAVAEPRASQVRVNSPAVSREESIADKVLLAHPAPISSVAQAQGSTGAAPQADGQDPSWGCPKPPKHGDFAADEHQPCGAGLWAVTLPPLCPGPKAHAGLRALSKLALSAAQRVGDFAGSPGSLEAVLRAKGRLALQVPAQPRRELGLTTLPSPPAAPQLPPRTNASGWQSQWTLGQGWVAGGQHGAQGWGGGCVSPCAPALWQGWESHITVTGRASARQEQAPHAAGVRGCCRDIFLTFSKLPSAADNF